VLDGGNIECPATLRNNLLNYHQPRTALAPFNKIANCLTPGGLLIIGAHETLPSGIKRFKQRSPAVWIKTQSYNVQEYNQP
jgi:chemotaxis methyl-accepting protein methylase